MQEDSSHESIVRSLESESNLSASHIEAQHKQKKIMQSLVVSALGLSLILVLFSYVYPSQKESETHLVTTGPLTSTLVVSGKVVPKSSATLSFETGGVVDNVLIKEGDMVKAGDLLMSIAAQDTETETRKAEAVLLKARADFKSLQSGASKAQIALKEVGMKTTEASLSSLYETILDTILTTSAVLDREVHGSLAPLFSEQNKGTYHFTFTSCDQVKQGTLESARADIEVSLQSLLKATVSLSSSSSRVDIDKVFSQSATTARSVKAYVAEVQDFLNASCNSKVANILNYQTLILASYTNISSITSNLQQLNSQLVLQKNAVIQAKKEYELTITGAKTEDKESLFAVVKQAEAALQGAKSILSKTKLAAPFDGTVVSVSIHKGELAKPGVPVAEILSSSGFYIEGYVREVDIPYLALRAPVKITLDAYPAPIAWTGYLESIDSSSREQGGVPLYKVKASFKDAEGDIRIKDGMSAKIGIILYENPSTIAVPARFIRVTQDGRAFVKKVLGMRKDVYEFEVTPGRRGDDGSLEVINGLSAGEILELMDFTKREVQSGGVSSPVKTTPDTRK